MRYILVLSSAGAEGGGIQTSCIKNRNETKQVRRSVSSVQ